MSHQYYTSKDRAQDAEIKKGADTDAANKLRHAADDAENVQERKDEALDERQFTSLTKRVAALETGFPVPRYPNLESLIARVVALESTTPIDEKLKALGLTIDQRVNAINKRIDELTVAAGPVM